MIKFNKKTATITLVLVAILSAGYLFFYSKNNSDTSKEKYTKSIFQEIEANEIELHATNKNGLLYNISANKVVQISHSQYNLTSINSKYYLNDSEDYANLISKNGYFDSGSNILNLYDDVKITFSTGYNITTSKLDINFNTMLLYTQEKALIQSNNGSIFSENGFINNINTKNIFFKGPVKTILANQ